MIWMVVLLLLFILLPDVFFYFVTTGWIFLVCKNSINDPEIAAATADLHHAFLSYTHRDWKRAQRADAFCTCSLRYLTLGCPRPLPANLCNHLPPHAQPSLADVNNLTSKSQLFHGDDDTILLVRKHTPPPPPDGRSCSSRQLTNAPTRIYVPLMARPWIMHACHSGASCHLGVTRTLRMLERFCWWVSMEICTKWWVRRCLKCQVRKPSRQTVR